MRVEADTITIPKTNEVDIEVYSLFYFEGTETIQKGQRGAAAGGRRQGTELCEEGKMVGNARGGLERARKGRTRERGGKGATEGRAGNDGGKGENEERRKRERRGENQ